MRWDAGETAYKTFRHPANQSASYVSQRRKADIVAGVRQMRSRPFHSELLPLVGTGGGHEAGSGVGGTKSERNVSASSKAILGSSHVLHRVLEADSSQSQVYGFGYNGILPAFLWQSIY
jgi:hypothetical protein